MNETARTWEEETVRAVDNTTRELYRLRAVNADLLAALEGLTELCEAEGKVCHRARAALAKAR